MDSTSEPDRVADELRGLLGRTDITRHVNTFNPTSRSYAVGDDLWVKVATDPRHSEALDRWASVAEVLQESYAAPRLLDRLVVHERPALVFERAPASGADQDELGALLPELLALTERLHADADLRASLDVGSVNTGPVTAGRALESVWGRRLREDLDIVEGSPESPGREVVEAWRREVAHLSELALSHSELVASPVHRDLWRDNVLVGSDRFWLIDWDDLGIGDPVADDAVLLFSALGADLEAWTVARPPLDVAQAERFALCARFQLLDRAIDPLADNVELPTFGYDEVKASKRSDASDAWERYREEFA